LLVVDNCDHVVSAVAEVLGGLTRVVPGLRILATSRQALGLVSERVLLVGPLAVPVGSGPDEIAASAAGQIFLNRARAVRPDFRLDGETVPHVAAICRHLDGLPLAIELIAGQAGQADVAELAER